MKGLLENNSNNNNSHINIDADDKDEGNDFTRRNFALRNKSNSEEETVP